MADSLLDIWKMKKRGARDAKRMGDRIKKSIKENLRDLITSQDIISTEGKKNIKIPIKYLDSYRFKYADDANREGTGQGNTKNKPGDAIAKDNSGQEGSGQAGDQHEEEVYEEEIAVKDLVDMLMEDFNLPWLQKKETETEVETENIKFTDIAEVGPLSNVDKKRTVYENMKRNAKSGHAEIAKIHPDDLRYKVWEVEKEYRSNAVCFLCMDRSGSMDEDKRYICKAFYFYLVHFCRAKYKNVELVFIAHDTEAAIVSEEDFFRVSGGGGTMCSSAFQLALDEMKAKYNGSAWNRYVFEFSDGDDFSSDIPKCIELVKQLLDEGCNAVGYGEISMDGVGSMWSWSSLHKEFEKEIKHPRFMSSVIGKKEDVYDCLKKFLCLRDEE